MWIMILSIFRTEVMFFQSIPPYTAAITNMVRLRLTLVWPAVILWAVMARLWAVCAVGCGRLWVGEDDCFLFCREFVVSLS